MAQARGYTAEDLFRLKTVADPQVSPDGSRIAYTVTEIDQDSNGYRSAIWLAEKGCDPRQITYSGKSVSQPRWSPDGSSLAFVSTSAGSPNQLYIMPMEGGEPRQITYLERGVSEVVWSPAGDSLAVTSKVGGFTMEEQGSSPWVITDLKYKFNGQGYFDGGKMQVFVVPLRGGEPIQVTQGDYDNGQIAWSPDGATIAFVSARHETRDRDTAADLWTVPAQGGHVRQLTNQFGDCNAPAFSPDGTTIAFASVGDPNDTAGRTTHVWVIPISGGPPRKLTGAIDRSVQAGSNAPGAPPAPIHWTPDGTGIIAKVHDKANIHVYRVSLEDGAMTPIVSGERCLNAVSVGPRGELACLISDQTHPGEIYHSDLSGSEPVKVSSANDELVDTVRFPEIEPIEIPLPDGETIEGWIIKPLNMEPGRKYPLVLDVHGGPHGAFFHTFQGSYGMSLSSRGCAVLQINPRGSTGWGEDFARYLHGGRGELDFPEFMAALDHVIAQGWVDEDRLGITGYSYGGYITEWAIGQTDRFQAAVGGAGVCDLYSHFAYTDNTVPRYKEMNGSPYDEPERYRRQSPLTYVQNVTTPLLLMHGDADLRCNTFQSDQFFNALKYYGKEVTYVRFPGEHHGFRQTGKPSNRLDYDKRLLAWFEKFLELES